MYPGERFNGYSHLLGLLLALPATALLLAKTVPTGDPARIAGALVFSLSAVALYAASTLFHSTRGRLKRMWERADHCAIYLLIAGTYTPFALLAFDGAVADAILIVVWVGAAAGLVLNLAWVDAPKWLTALVFIALGWVGVVAVPEMLDLGIAPAVLVFVGGGLYTLGALSYALRRPNPAPATFGYHEIFHVLVICAAAAHFVAIAGFVVPLA